LLKSFSKKADRNAYSVDMDWRECTNGDQKMQEQSKADADGALLVLPGPFTGQAVK
jgi:hypothetical protein